MTPSDTILMQRIVARDSEAFSVLFDRYQGQVTGQIRRMLRDGSVADFLFANMPCQPHLPSSRPSNYEGDVVGDGP